MDQSELLRIMAETVATSGDCVLEVIMGENGLVAHLIPVDVWEAEEGESDEI